MVRLLANNPDLEWTKVTLGDVTFFTYAKDIKFDDKQLSERLIFKEITYLLFWNLYCGHPDPTKCNVLSKIFVGLCLRSSTQLLICRWQLFVR